MNDGADKGSRQRLAAILAADAAGYSRLMVQDEAATMAALDAARAVFRSEIELHHGRVIDMAGDSVLAVFETATGAVSAALAVQKQLDDLAAGVPADRRMRFRIGVHLGDVIEKSDGSVYGDGVNVAARLQALAQPGELAVSDAVRAVAGHRVAARFEDLGEQQVKNIDRPLRVFRVVPTGGGSDGQARRSTSVPRRTRWIAVALVAVVVAGVAIGAAWRSLPRSVDPATAVDLSVAVLPFAAAAAAADETLAAAVTQGLTTALAQWHRAQVAESDPAARGQAGDPGGKAVGHDLKVRYVVTGEVRTNERISVVARVVDRVAATQVWSGSVDVPAGDAAEGVLRVRLSSRVRTAINAAERRRSALAAPPLSPQQLVWRGDAAWSSDQIGLAGIAAASRLYDQALRIDPQFLDAIVSKGWALNGEFEESMSSDRATLAQAVDALSSRAVGLDPRNPDAWDLRATALGWLGRWDEALAANDRSRALDPSELEYRSRRAWLLLSVGKAAEVVALEEQLIALDPPGSSHMQRHLCQGQLLLGHYAAAVVACEQAGALDQWWFDQIFLVAAYAQLGDAAKAATAKAALLRGQPLFTIGAFMAKRRSDDAEYLRQMNAHVLPGLRRAGVPE